MERLVEKPKRLPKIRWEGVVWFVDCKLQQIRSVDTMEYIEFCNLPKNVLNKII